VATFHASHKLKAVIQGDEKSQDWLTLQVCF
jgi:hypothetical protein